MCWKSKSKLHENEKKQREKKLYAINVIKYHSYVYTEKTSVHSTCDKDFKFSEKKVKDRKTKSNNILSRNGNLILKLYLFTFPCTRRVSTLISLFSRAA